MKLELELNKRTLKLVKCAYFGTLLNINKSVTDKMSQDFSASPLTGSSVCKACVRSNAADIDVSIKSVSNNISICCGMSR